jgi:DNA primase
MAFPPQFLDELRARLPVSEVVGKRVKLKKAGREWKGLSPFNKEKTPSFTVNDQKGFYHDFSSGKHGDIFGFVMETEGVTFPEAVERLASMAGLPMPKFSREEEARDERRKTLHGVMELAAKFFQATLSTRAGAKARGYLADRGIEPATQLRFRMGYAPGERFALKEHLGSHGIPVSDMIEAGLIIAGDDIPVPYDRFRDRVMFPIADLRGRVIAFGGRALEKDVSAKYLNSPETPLFHKGSNLYNLPAARMAAHNAGKSTQSAHDYSASIVVVEGYVDVIAMVSVGFEACVAPLGTALTEDQLSLLWKMNDEPVLCFDGDSAGRAAAYRAIDIALPRLQPGKSLKFALLPEGQDPDDLVRSGGREAVAEVLAQARPLAQVLWTRETEAGGFDTPERRAALEARVSQITAGIGDETVRKYYRQDFSERLRALFGQNEIPRARRMAGGGAGGERWRQDQWQPGQSGRGGAASRGGSYPDRAGPGASRPGQPYLVASPQLATSAIHRGHRTAIPTREALILQAVLNHPWLLHDHLEELAQIEFRHAEAGRLKGLLIDIYSHDEGIDGLRMRAEVAARGLGDLLERADKAITSNSVWGLAPDTGPEDVLLTWKQLVALHRQWHSLIKELKDAELALGQDGSEANYSWLRDVKARLSEIDGTEALIEGFGLSSGRPARTF